MNFLKNEIYKKEEKGESLVPVSGFKGKGQIRKERWSPVSVFLSNVQWPI